MDKSIGNTKIFCKIENLGHAPQISQCVTINSDSTWKVHVYGREVERQTCSLLDMISTKLDTPSLLQLLHMLDSCKICAGHPESEFLSLLETRKGHIVSSSGQQSACIDKSMPVLNADGLTVHATVRATACEILTNRPLRCIHCMDYRSNLRAIHAKARKATTISTTSRVETSSHTNYRYTYVRIRIACILDTNYNA